MTARFQNAIITVINIILAIILIIILARPGQRSKEIEVKIAAIEDISSLPYWVAYDMGIFERNGVKFKPNEVSRPLDELENTLKGALYASFGIDYTFSIFKTSGDFRILRILYYSKDNGDGLVVKDTGIDLESLSGKRIGYYDNTRYNVLLEEVFRKVGDTAVDFIGLALEEMESALDNGRVDAIYATEPLLSYLESKGYKVLKRNVIFTPDIPIIHGMGISSAVNLSLRKDALDRIKKSIKEAIDYINSNPEEAKKILQKHIGLKIDKIPKFLIPEDVKDFQKFNQYLISNKLIPYSTVEIESILSEK